MRITKRAAQKAKAFREEAGSPDSWVLCVSLQGGGCSGFKYQIDFMEPPENESLYKSIEKDGLRVLVDKKSYVFLAGTEIDYEETMMSSGFAFNSPMASSKCGCGESVGF
jgi:iron-sulfur cluster assembly protein|tara:strand:- start:374 stop:703 length:330 start_codon:yes stop_codon:yes gene_type:complete